ncbi:tyrosine-type recombinase/integrase [Deinococcus hopiensis]|uniref:tyrosine-type recombinase/integrase n=1 Tax=Deinococcus hopiensis TaxID=309885 RepID=UPI001BAFB898
MRYHPRHLTRGRRLAQPRRSTLEEFPCASSSGFIGPAKREAVARHHRQSPGTPGTAAAGKGRPGTRRGGPGLHLRQRVGRPTEPRTLYGWYRQIVAQAGLPPIRFHDLRHTAASLMISRGIDDQDGKRAPGVMASTLRAGYLCPDDVPVNRETGRTPPTSRRGRPRPARCGTERAAHRCTAAILVPVESG